MSTAIKKFKVEGMHCSSCAMSIDFDLEDIEGVKSATTNYASQVSVVEIDNEKVKVEDIIKSIKRIGYSAYLIKNTV